VAEAFGLRGSLELPANRALGFYGIVGAATLGGGALAATNIDPIAMLFWAAVVNGVVAVHIMVAMMLVVSGGKGLRSLSLPRWLTLLGWLCGSINGSDRGTARLVEFCMKKLSWIDSDVQGPIRYVRYGSMLSIKSATSSVRATIESKCRVF
jgi:hypothetical protein